MGQAVLVDIIEECCAQHIVQVIGNIGAVCADGLGQVHDSQLGVEVEMLFLENVAPHRFLGASQRPGANGSSMSRALAPAG